MKVLSKAPVLLAISLAFALLACPVAFADDVVEGGDAAEQQAIADQQAADAVAAQIDALPAAADITSADEDAIAAARDAYNQLTSAQKSLVANANALTEAESYLGAAIANERSTADADAANRVSTAIGVLPIVDLGDYAEEDYPLVMQQTEEVEALYYSLTDEQKALVLDIGRIRAMDQEIGARMQSDDPAEAEADLQAGVAVREMISAIFSELDSYNESGYLQVDFTNVDKAQLQAEIDAANDAYHQLSYPQRHFVPNSGDLLTLEWLLICDNVGVDTKVE